jgi:hypothetical protein
VTGVNAVAPGLLLVAALRNGAVLAARPSGRVHVYAGALTASGRYVPRASRVLCGATTRRLSVVPTATLSPRRRVCKRCSRLLGVPGTGSSAHPRTREEWVTAFTGLTVADLHQAAVWCRTVAETHTVGMVLSQQHGPTPINPRTPEQSAHRKAADTLIARRRHLEAVEMSPEDRARAEAKAEAEAYNRALVDAARAREIQIGRVVDRRNQGVHLFPWERELLDTA